MHITWTPTDRDAWAANRFTGHTGTDEAGNVYTTPAHGETCHVRTPDGFEGSDWTPEDALRSALEKRALTAKAAASPACTIIRDAFRLANLSLRHPDIA